MFNRAPSTLTDTKAEMGQNILFFFGLVLGVIALAAFSNGEFAGMLICGGLSFGAFRWSASIKTTYEAESQTTRYRKK